MATGLWLSPPLRGDPAHHFVDQPAERQPVRLDDDVRRFAVERIALVAQRAQARLGVGDLQQRPAPIATQALPEQVMAGVEEHADRPGVQQLSIVGAKHGAAARRDDRAAGIDERGQHLGFALPERRLALVLEQAGDRAAGPALDDLVAVDEGPLEPARHFLADRGLAAAGQTDQ